MSNIARLRAFALCLLLLAIVALPAAAGLPVAASGDGPKVVFQINDKESAPTVLRFVTNYLIAEPTAQIAVVGYGPGIDFMLIDAKDPNGKPYEAQLVALADRGVAFKVCNNTLKSRNLTPAVVGAQATVVPSAVNEIIRLQTREGYAYFQHQK
ncbi:MAG: DsrE family protein [Burkholderiales bacterium]